MYKHGRGDFYLKINHLTILLPIIFLFSTFRFVNSYSQIRIMPLGDSITQGERGSTPVGGFRDDLVYMLLAENVDFEMVGTLIDGDFIYPRHEGHPGKTAGYIANNIIYWMNQTNPDIVLLHIGTNDINANYSNSRIRDDIEKILTTIWNYDTNIPILLCSLIPRGDSYNDVTTDLSRLVHQLAIDKLQQGKLIRYVGQNEIWVSNPRWANQYIDETLFHPNNLGYTIMAEAYFNILLNQLTGTSQFITDNFNRSYLGYTWKIDSHYQLKNKKLTTDTGGNYWWKPAVYVAEMDPIAVTFTYGSDVYPLNNGNAGIAVLLNNNSPNADGYLIYKDNETGKLRLFLINDGAVEPSPIDEIEGIQPTPHIDDEFKVAIFSDENGHHFNCFLNDYFDGELTDSDKFQGNSSELFAGIMLAGTSNNIVDNFKLIHFKGQAERMFCVWGNDQQGKINTTLKDSLVVGVTDINGNPISNIQVTFEVTAGDATLDTQETGTHIIFEAEDGELTFPMQIMNDTAASGGKYIEVPAEFPDDSMAKAKYTFTITENDNYVVWGRVKSTGDTHDSFKIIMDEQPEIAWHIFGKWNWTWDQVYVYGGEDPKIFYLTAGTHTFTVKNREWGSQLDKLIITNDLNYSPDGFLAKNNSTIITNSSGKAFVKVHLGSTIGPVEITASSTVLSDVVLFHSYIISEEPAYLSKSDGDEQSAGIGQQLPLPFEVTVTDQYQNPMQNVLVLFELIEGQGGSLIESQPVSTNVNGKATSHFVLGSNEGLYRVQASCPGYPSIPAVIFNATAQQIGYSISGNVVYFNNNRPVNNVTLNIIENEGLIDSAITNSNGNYFIHNITPGIDLKITPERAIHDYSNQLITIYNAALIMQHVVKLDTLKGDYFIAADVDKNENLQSYDAALIANYSVGLARSTDSHVGEWIFRPSQRKYFNIVSNYSNEDYTGLLLGDVQGNWDQSYGLIKQSTQTNYEYLDNVIVTVGDSFTIPLKIDENKHMISCYVIFKYDSRLLNLISVNKTQLSDHFQLVYHDNEKEGILRAGLFSAYQLNDAGSVIEFIFQANRLIDQRTVVMLEKFQVNNEIIQQATAVVEINSSQAPKDFILYQNYPNPFSTMRGYKSGGNSMTVIPYQLPQAGNVHILLYNLLGQQITTLYKGYQQLGYHKFTWDGKDKNGNEVAGGVFICELIFNNQRKSIKLIKLH